LSNTRAILTKKILRYLRLGEWQDFFHNRIIIPLNFRRSNSLAERELILKNKENNNNNYESDTLSEVVSENVSGFFRHIGALTLFTIRFFKNIFIPPYEWNEILHQAYRLGYQSFLLVGVTSFIVGMVLTLQSQPTLADLGAEAWLPSMVSLSVVKEVAPLITGLVCAGKVGSSIGAEIGSMKVTEQIDAMEISGANPMNFLVTSRVLAVTLTVPVLVFYADALGLIGGYVAMQLHEDVTWRFFISESLGVIKFKNVYPAVIKSVLFGFTIGIVGCYQGYNAKKGTLGVGKAANASVVTASLLIFIIDLIVVQVVQIIN